ncbi:polyisoprenoid-binding protein YceI [Sphingobacterium allocomposti]|uniref:Polyisoprenoid-binding protein YceI n=1 Tax=Sphingobacterium allocomposti TaxID=415956 RepID=A0A5S5DLA5_9SPHI|nr:YceI family protein [Sphingobacterium composti Yoo et al. 2007 non Ten et al. 2007]TYP96703.1 polyisoprenoid-binding protein YceI [Sphingobacterium composti Yoo et al. 2007 non Ten et al. 2007]HLS94286.1 YceI family protein [Sphingobacterium sp.]
MVTWNLDKAHSEIEFRVRHMMISSVKGFFQDFNITMSGDPQDISTASIRIAIPTSSINTKNEQRDQHLRGEDFFDSNQFPEITFESTAIKKLNDGKYDVTGNLTIRNITKPTTFHVEVGGVAKDPWGNEKIGFAFNGRINREDFGLTWNTPLETGGVLVGDEVKIQGDVQFILN